MEGISDIKICGIDETRPPMIKKEPYIDLNFKLIHKAPKDWCNDFKDRELLQRAATDLRLEAIP